MLFDQEEIQNLSGAKGDDLIRILRELTAVQRKIADLQVELQGRKVILLDFGNFYLNFGFQGVDFDHFVLLPNHFYCLVILNLALDLVFRTILFWRLSYLFIELLGGQECRSPDACE